MRTHAGVNLIDSVRFGHGGIDFKAVVRARMPGSILDIVLRIRDELSGTDKGETAPRLLSS